MFGSEAIGVVGIVLLALVPGEAYRNALQRRVRAAMPITAYQVSDTPEIGVPGRVVIGLYLVALACAGVLATRFWAPGAVPDPRLLADGLTPQVRGLLLDYGRAGLAVLVLATFAGLGFGALHGWWSARRIRTFQSALSASAGTVRVPWTKCSEPWMRALLTYESPDIALYMRDRSNDKPITGRLLAADLFYGDEAGRGLLLEPIDAAGRPDATRRIFIRASDVELLITSQRPVQLDSSAV